jgi:hypothetical protein
MGRVIYVEVPRGDPRLRGTAGGSTSPGQAVAAAVAVILVLVLAFRHPAAHGHAAHGHAVPAGITAPGTRLSGAVTAAGPRGPVTTMPQMANEQLANRMAAALGWGPRQQTCLDLLWTYESAGTWSATVANPTSGAYGIPQSLPGSKMAASGSDWQTNPATQVRWGLGYVRDNPNYGTPCAAWDWEIGHNWY